MLKLDSSIFSTFSINLPFCFSVFDTNAFLFEIDFSILPLSLVLFLDTSHKWAIPSSRVIARTYPSFVPWAASLSFFSCIESKTYLIKVNLFGALIVIA
jgi:hypothetical protein